MILFPNAKINLGLKITEKRSDGFHNLVSCFYPVAWNDILEVVPNQENVEFRATGIPIPAGEKENLCVQAYRLLEQDFGIPPVYIHLHKQIPIGAGLGGGSSDATFTLKALNELYQLGLSNEKLKTYARQLGSDCAFFVDNKPVLAIEKGDQFQPIDLDLSAYTMVLVYPSKHISTAEAYAGIQAKPENTPLKTLLAQPINTWQGKVVNDFEIALTARFDFIEEIKAGLKQLGAVYTAMSGSGSTVFGIFENQPELEGNFEGYTVKTVRLA